MTLPPHLQAFKASYDRAWQAYEADRTEGNLAEYVRRFDGLRAALKASLTDGLAEHIVARAIPDRAGQGEIEAALDRVQSRLRPAPPDLYRVVAPTADHEQDAA